MNYFEVAMAEAKVAAQKAFDEAKPNPVVFGSPSSPWGNDVDLSQPHSVSYEGVSGFAWVNIWADARKQEGKEIKAAGFHKDYQGAFYVSAYDFGAQGQFMDRKSAACKAAAKVLQSHGYEAYAQERMD